MKNNSNAAKILVNDDNLLLNEVTNQDEHLSNTKEAKRLQHARMTLAKESAGMPRFNRHQRRAAESRLRKRAVELRIPR